MLFFGLRFKREEVKIQAWENHEKRKAEMEMKKIEVHECELVIKTFTVWELDCVVLNIVAST